MNLRTRATMCLLYEQAHICTPLIRKNIRSHVVSVFFPTKKYEHSAYNRVFYCTQKKKGSIVRSKKTIATVQVIFYYTCRKKLCVSACGCISMRENWCIFSCNTPTFYIFFKFSVTNVRGMCFGE